MLGGGSNQGAWGCIGAVLASLISGAVALAIARMQLDHGHKEQPALHRAADEPRALREGNASVGSSLSAETLGTPKATRERMEANVIHSWTEANAVGLTVHARFSVRNAMNKLGHVAVYFSSGTGQPLRDLNRRFNSRGGRVSVGSEFSSPYDSATYNDFPLFIPYNELHLPPGRHVLKYSVHVFCMEPLSQLAASGEGMVKVEI